MILLSKFKNVQDNLPIEHLPVLEDNYYEKIDTDIKYSIEVDPENKYHFTDTQKDFITNYVQFKNVPLAAKLSDIDEGTALMYYNSYSVKMEIRRINLAMYHRAFATRMLEINEIGGYLTSLIMDENVAEADKLGTRDKLQVTKQLIEINKLKQESMSNPDKIIDAIDIQEDLSTLSVDTIKKLIDNSGNTKKAEEKEEIIEQIEDNNNGLTIEEVRHLKTLPSSELLNILEETNKIVNEKAEEKVEEKVSIKNSALAEKLKALKENNTFKKEENVEVEEIKEEKIEEKDDDEDE